MCLGIYLLFGLQQDCIGPFFIAWSLMGCVVNAFFLQVFQLNSIEEGAADVVATQFSTMMTSIYFDAAMSKLFGIPEESLYLFAFMVPVLYRQLP